MLGKIADGALRGFDALAVKKAPAGRSAWDAALDYVLGLGLISEEDALMIFAQLVVANDLSLSHPGGSTSRRASSAPMMHEVIMIVLAQQAAARGAGQQGGGAAATAAAAPMDED